MLNSLAKVAVGLNLDGMANSVMERLYATSVYRSGFARRFQIVNYHKVSPDPHPYFQPTLPAVFDSQMRFLKKCYQVMPLLEIVDRSHQGDLPDRAVAITFDDGYLDNYEYAFTILKKYSLPATIFVATGAIDTGQLLWHDRVFDAFRYTTVTRASLSDPELGDLVLDAIATRRESLDRVLRRTRQLYGKVQSALVEEVEEALKPAFPSHYPDPRMLSWEQIREMYQAGIAFGSHTVTHPVLSQLPTVMVLKEVLESKVQLSDQLGTPITTFAYPNGQNRDYTDDVKQILKECGYLCAVTTERGVNEVDDDAFELKRIGPWPEQVESFRLNFCLERHGWTS